MKLRPRFSLRTLLVLVTLISLSMGWVAYNRYWVHQRREFSGRNGDVQWSLVQVPDRKRPPWPLGLFGDQGYSLWDLKAHFHTSEKQRIRELFPELELYPELFLDGK